MLLSLLMHDVFEVNKIKNISKFSSRTDSFHQIFLFIKNWQPVFVNSFLRIEFSTGFIEITLKTKLHRTLLSPGGVLVKRC